MKQALDRQKLRLDYLKKKRQANAKLVVIAGSFLGAIWTLGIAGRMLSMPAWLILLLWVLMLGVYTPATIFNWRFMQKAAKSIPVVPPVTLDMLAAEETLVRGSAAPPVARGAVLLRAAQKGRETQKDELLRGSQE